MDKKTVLFICTQNSAVVRESNEIILAEFERVRDEIRIWLEELITAKPI